MHDELARIFQEARNGTLPTGFDRWDLSYSDGWTVAHTAAHYGTLPANFNRCDLADDDGLTVSQVVEKRKSLR